ncbi:hypothetical protein KSF_106640 [Reticulibacter mediterranei]|uniref:Uncharacterized protein n=1 Tax=Reticulibacter mediterranei TaxID=2778369 RepID=A0A8J3ITR0_9CHLR|nr:hypothetical protein [Reticulibacter mediterranei]GHP00617.1 hypothetical protein KSF_106640 [Reticulibacter mediterranei]
MTTKAQLEQRLKESNQALEAARSALKQTQQILHCTHLAVKVMRDDLDHMPFTLSHEAGSEQAERYERGLQLTKERLETLWNAIERGEEVSLIESLWRETPTEHELFSSYVEQIH